MTVTGTEFAFSGVALDSEVASSEEKAVARDQRKRGKDQDQEQRNRQGQGQQQQGGGQRPGQQQAEQSVLDRGERPDRGGPGQHNRERRLDEQNRKQSDEKA